MTPEDWQAYQAQRTGNAPNSAASAASRYQPVQPVAQPPRRGGLGWPMAFLLLGLAMIGGCCYSFAKLADSFSPFESISSGPGVGVLVMENEIYGSIWVTEAINKFKNDKNVRAVVIRVNSPGGAVAPCQEIYKAVKGLNKPVVISMGSVAASGGLYVAAAGDVIMANPGTITGSIGVIMQSVEVSGTMEKIGLKSQTIKSGEFKDIGSPFREMKDNEREILQKMVLDVYEQFVADLVAGRPNMNEAELRRLADGRIYNGSEAKKLGLVDELGGFEDAVMRAAKLGGLPTDKRPDLIIEDGRKSWLSSVLDSKLGLNISVPPAFQPGFSLKYIYQPEMGDSSQGS